MAVTLFVTVYGFGSAFNGTRSPKDVDLLVVHAELDRGSCDFAIRCKRRLEEQLRAAHVTMLSETEEVYFEFVARAGAHRLGNVRGDRFDQDVAALCGALQQYQTPLNRPNV